MTNHSKVRCLLILVFIGSNLSASDTQAEEPLSRIAFGSCCRQDRPAPIWDSIVAQKPERFLFIGDNIYGDSEDLEVLKVKWKLLTDMPGYQILKATCPILATWDDHDYGVNDGGLEYPKRKESQQLFLDVFDEPANSARRIREGIYDASIVGPPGKRVQFILLDTRYHRSPLKKVKQEAEDGEGIRGPYGPSDDPMATMLGEEQWKWLAEKLRQPAEVRIIASSVQVIAEQHGSEKWGNFPKERERLFKTIKDAKAGGVILISGDRHLAELSRQDVGLGYPLYDITSSSLNVPSGNFTSTGARWKNEVNRHRVGLEFFETNFGMITIDWKESDPLLRLQVRDEKGSVVLQQRVRLSELAAK
ncbi:MAG: alkaline phosphatase D family protein [Pirellulaceae bacterium]